jgi:hypothetical protein
VKAEKLARDGVHLSSCLAHGLEHYLKRRRKHFEGFVTPAFLEEPDTCFVEATGDIHCVLWRIGSVVAGKELCQQQCDACMEERL